MLFRSYQASAPSVTVSGETLARAAAAGVRADSVAASGIPRFTVPNQAWHCRGRSEDSAPECALAEAPYFVFVGLPFVARDTAGVRVTVYWRDQRVRDGVARWHVGVWLVRRAGGWDGAYVVGIRE